MNTILLARVFPGGRNCLYRASIFVLPNLRLDVMHSGLHAYLLLLAISANGEGGLNAQPEGIPAPPVEMQPFQPCECGECGCLPTCLHHCGDLVPNFGYVATPKTYYYFRPYQYFHVPIQQRQALEWGAEPGLPYSNAIFQDVYKAVESKSLPAAVSTSAKKNSLRQK